MLVRVSVRSRSPLLWLSVECKPTGDRLAIGPCIPHLFGDHHKMSFGANHLISLLCFKSHSFEQNSAFPRPPPCGLPRSFFHLRLARRSFLLPLHKLLYPTLESPSPIVKTIQSIRTRLALVPTRFTVATTRSLAVTIIPLLLRSTNASWTVTMG